MLRVGAAGEALLAAVALSWLSGRADASVLRAVVAANAVTALAARAWAVPGVGLGFGPRVLLVVVAVALTGLAAGQLAVARR